jgi:hypothetical protein
VYPSIYLGRSAYIALSLLIKSSPIDVSIRGITFRIATDINSILGLINSDVVDFHSSGKRETSEVNRSKTRGHSQVGDNVLSVTEVRNQD